MGASRILLRDWSTGKLPRFTLPGSTPPIPIDSSRPDLYATDEQILASLPTRKERRKTSGVVKLSASASDARRLSLEAPWVIPEGEGSEDGGEEEEEEGLGEEQSEGDDEDGGEGEEEEEEEEVQPVGKRKRTSQQSVFLRPTKKVAFAAEPKGTKQSRSTAGARGALAARGKEAKIKPQSGKPPVKAKVTKATPAKVANTVSSKTPVKTTSNGEETYDFKKFF